MAEHAVTSSDQAHALSAHLQDPARAAPVVVVSVAAGQREPYVDSVELSAELAGLAELYVLPTGPISWAFAAQMPDHTEVYGGAARVYPIGVEWVHDVRRSPLRFAYGPGDQTRVTEAVITDAMAAAAFLVTRAAPTSHTRVAGRVAGDVSGRVLVTLDSGQVRMATIWPELVVEGVNAERLFTPDMPVDGVLDMHRRRLDVTGMRVSASRALAAYTPGAVVLGRVRYVERTLCVVELFPAVEASIDAADAFTGEVVDLRTVMSEGETLPVRVTPPRRRRRRLGADPGRCRPRRRRASRPSRPPWRAAVAAAATSRGRCWGRHIDVNVNVAGAAAHGRQRPARSASRRQRRPAAGGPAGRRPR